MKGAMKEISASMTIWLTRRGFLGKLAVAGAAVGGAWLIPGGGISELRTAGSREDGTSVVSFHMDQPYLDTTGKAAPYHPPVGARSAAPVAHLSEEAFRRAQSYA
jgi:hypothetical protein